MIDTLKNKKFAAILLVCVAALWGIIFYRIYLAMDEKIEIVPQTPKKKIEYFKAINHVKDKVKLKLNYRDPFSMLNTIEEIEKEPEKPAKAPITSAVIPKPQIAWGSILYTGFITNTTSKQNSVIMFINGKETLLTEGQTLNGVKLIKYAGDSVKIQYQNHTKYIKLK